MVSQQKRLTEMGKIRSEFTQIEQFVTTDGKEFLLEDQAQLHQEYLNHKENFERMVDEHPERFVLKTHRYLSKLTKEMKLPT